jgi:hypothetical protein
VFPIGFSWALHRTQDAHCYLLETAEVGGKLIDEVFVATWAIGSSADEKKAHAALSGHGLPLHGTLDDETTVDVLGVELNGAEWFESS